VGVRFRSIASLTGGLLVLKGKLPVIRLASLLARCLPKGPLVTVSSRKVAIDISQGEEHVSKKLLIGFAVVALAAASSGCSTSENANASANSNANTAVANNTTQPGPDNSEITTATDASGVKTETRVFHNNPRVSRVVVTTRDGKRTTTVYGPTGESKDLKDETVDVLKGAGNAIADAAGFVADKAEDLAGKTKEGAKTVGEKTAEGAKTAAEKTKEGAKTAAEKTKEGAKKAGSAIKKAVTP
jgi:hypothetical protein